MKDKKKKVVVTFIEAGQGHIVTAEAIAESLEKKYSDYIDVERNYIFRDSNDKDLVEYEKFSIAEVLKANNNKSRLFFQMFMMKLFGERTSLRFVYGTVFKKIREKIIKSFINMKADMIISTYFVPYHAGVIGKKRGNLGETQIVAYNPDHNTHGWWDRNGDMFICNNPMASKEAKEKHHKNIYTVNFMARQSIVNANESKNFYRKKYNIPLDKFAVVLADGAYAAARLEEYCDELLKTNLPLTIIPICGKNEKLLKKYEEMKKIVKSNITLLPMPFMKDVHEVYGASDLFITKAGPNAITDCMFMGTPIVTNFYTGPIERATSKLFTQYYKTGIYISESDKARLFVEDCIKCPDIISQFRENTKKFDKTKNGADEIADLVAGKLGVKIKQ